MVVPGPADAGPLRGQQRPEPGPLGVGQLHERGAARPAAGPAGRSARSRARRAAWQRLARAWCARRHRDQRRRCARRAPRSARASRRRRTSGTVRGIRPGSGPPLFGRLVPAGGEAGHGQVGVGEQGQGDEAVPGRPGAHLVLVEAHLALRLGEPLLHLPPHAADPHQLLLRRALRPVGDVEGEVVGVDRPAGARAASAASPGRSPPPGAGTPRRPPARPARPSPAERGATRRRREAGGPLGRRLAAGLEGTAWVRGTDRA